MPFLLTRQPDLNRGRDTILFYLYPSFPKWQAMSRFENSTWPNDKTKWLKRQIVSSCTALTSYRDSIRDYTLNHLKSFKTHDGGNLPILTHPAKYIQGNAKVRREQRWPGGAQGNASVWLPEMLLRSHARLGTLSGSPQSCLSNGPSNTRLPKMSLLLYFVGVSMMTCSPTSWRFFKGQSKKVKCN